MKLHFNRKDLRDALRRMQPVFSNRTSNGLLQISTTASFLLNCSNPVFQYEQQCSAKIEEAGECAVSAFRLLAALENSTAEECVLESRDKTLLFQCGQNKLKLALSDERFQPVTFTPNTVVEIESLALVPALKKSIPFMSKNDARPNLECIKLESEKGTLSIVATNGRRLIHTELACSKDGINCAISEQTCRLMESMEGLMRLSFSNNQMSAETEGAKLSSGLLEVEFPAWKSFMPKQSEREISFQFDRKEMLGAISFAGISSSPTARPFINLIPNGKSIRVGTAIAEAETDTNVSAKISGKIEAIGFDVQYLSSALEAMDEPEAKLMMKDEVNSAILRDRNTTFVIFPARILTKTT